MGRSSDRRIAVKLLNGSEIVLVAGDDAIDMGDFVGINLATQNYAVKSDKLNSVGIATESIPPKGCMHVWDCKFIVFKFPVRQDITVLPADPPKGCMKATECEILS